MRVETSENLIGKTGSDSVSLTFAAKALPVTEATRSGTVPVCIYIPDDPAPLVRDLIRFYFGDRELREEDAALSEQAGDEESLIFHGNIESIKAIVAFKEFGGLTPLVDTFKATIEFVFDGGDISIMAAVFLETGPGTKLFRTALSVPGGGERPTIWAVSKVTNDNGTEAGFYMPFTVRYAGAIPAEDVVVDVNGSGLFWEFSPFPSDGLHYLEGASLKTVVVVPDPGDRTKVRLVYFDEKNNRLGSSSLKRSEAISSNWTLSKKATPPFFEVGKRVPIIWVELGVDADRNGRIDDSDLEREKSKWTFGPSGHGAVLIYNNDDDDAKNFRKQDYDALKVDADDDIVNGPNDIDDLAPLLVRKIAHPVPSEGWQLLLKVSDKSKIRVFGKREAGAAAVIGPSSGDAWEISVASAANDLMLGMEATQYPDEGFDGMIRISLLLKNPAGDTVAQDDAMVRVAPWMMIDNLQRPELLFVVKMTRPDNAAFRRELHNAAVAAGMSANRICEIDGDKYRIAGPGGGDYEDRWIQDAIEIGASKSPFGESWAVLNSPREEGFGLNLYAKSALLGPGMGWFAKGDLTTVVDPHEVSLSAFGNLEVTPPFVCKNAKYPFGRILYGGGAAGKMDKHIREFLAAQKFQHPIEIDTNWLAVGHVDEVISFIPSAGPSGKGFRVVIASPRKAISILKELQKGGRGDLRLLEGKADPEDKAKYNGRTVDDVINHLGDYNIKLCGEIDGIKVTLIRELELKNDDFIEAPVLFYEENGLAKALTGNMTNLVVLGTTLVIPKPFGPRDGAVDKFEDVFLGVLRGGNVVFVDDWDAYHLAGGNVHCATNVKRRPRDVKWWEHHP
ncbi:MAG: hypothetical protein N3A38_04245 [Planctomycetota bacterium]|nr:hypothetical protein [Planctomycetota bacterium]